MGLTAEELLLEETREKKIGRRDWGPCLSERQCSHQIGWTGLVARMLQTAEDPRGAAAPADAGEVGIDADVAPPLGAPVVTADGPGPAEEG